MFRVQAVPTPLHAPGEPAAERRTNRHDRGRYTVYALSMVAVGAVALGLAWSAGQVTAAFALPEFWLMAALALLADARTFIAIGRHGKPVIVCPSLCFTFAILLCWDLGPALLVQVASVVVVAWRMRYGFLRAAAMAGRIAIASTAAYGALVLCNPDPFNSIGAAEATRDVVGVLLAVVFWLVAYQALRMLGAWLWNGRRPVARGWDSPPMYETLFIAALLLLSPVLALAAHVSAAFVPLVFVPLLAVERMARLSAERDRMARQDPLTDLANRTGLQAAFADLRADDQHDLPVAMLLLDLNRFKYVNDALGHEVGDRLLVAVAGRLRDAVPPGATAARLGGDEFAVIAAVPGGAARAESLADDICGVMATPVMLEGLQVDISGSIGIAVSPDHGTDFATVMRHADVAMYQAKHRGHAVATYAQEDDHNSPERLALLTDFRGALDAAASQISLHYQPQVDLATNRVVGVEALLRWQHPTLGAVPPRELLRIAEHTPVMRMITNRVIDEVVAQAARWYAAGINLRASLNVSIRDLHGEEVATRLTAQLAAHRVPAELIQVEITESALTADPAQLTATIERLTAAGVAISLDDFGTGYSSLQHLRRLPLAEIKIDRSFVAGIAHDADDAVIVRSTVELARALGLRVVAEGVENHYTAKLLAEAGCGLAQGWLYARPMPGDEVMAWLTRHASASPTIGAL
jgi:diguanylate cyclase (GGDEF)-like protein